ncbi:MAG: type II toxin-antitoxin system VapC family toxin [Solirubrobacteraceae bacterium]
MIVLDTHAWLWWISQPAKLGHAAREAIDSAERVGIATISAWEIAMLVQKGRITLDRPLEPWINQALSNPRVVALALSASTAVRAGLLDRERFPGDPADRIVYSTARAWDAHLATRDEALRSFDPRGTVWD